ncbi:MAG: hypothetical protein CMJ58_22640 [Planctomycetaceae bacterium]|nr:hypothetical protein [Planctomycetaceae bacterium]
MNPDDQRLLVRIVAALEVLFEPYRPKATPSAALASIMGRRRDYRGGSGLSWTVGGEAGARMRGMRSLKRLQAAGLIQTIKGRSDRRCGVKLRRVDACLSLTPTKLTSEAWGRLEHVAALEKQRGVRRNAGYVSERDVVGMADDSTDGKLVRKFTDDAMGLLIAGYLDTFCDTTGSIGWCVTDAGRKALKAGRPEPDDLGAYDSAIAGDYMDIVAAGLADREHWCDDTNSVAIPLASGSWS